MKPHSQSDGGRSATLGEIRPFTWIRHKVLAKFREVQKVVTAIIPAPPSCRGNSSSVANYFCNCSLARAAKDAAGRNNKIGRRPAFISAVRQSGKLIDGFEMELEI